MRILQIDEKVKTSTPVARKQKNSIMQHVTISDCSDQDSESDRKEQNLFKNSGSSSDEQHKQKTQKRENVAVVDRWKPTFEIFEGEPELTQRLDWKGGDSYLFKGKGNYIFIIV